MRQVGEIVAQRYVILSATGEGGMAAVYRASDQREDREVAIKEVQLTAADLPIQFIHRKFLEEVETLKRLNHPQIPHIWDAFADGDTGSIVMELVEGENLLNLLAGAALPANLVVEIALQICAVLRYMHEQPGRGTLHRDIKPSNIMLRKKPIDTADVALVDFGLARSFNPDSCSTMTTCGTLGYAPPEQLDGKAEPRSDLYALGATMFYMLTGHQPIPLTVCSPQGQSIPPQLAAIVEKATQQQPQARFASAADMEQALLKFHNSRSGSGKPLSDLMARLAGWLPRRFF